MGKVITFIGSQGAGKSSTAANTLWAVNDLLKGFYAGRSDKRIVGVIDATPEGTISGLCNQDKPASVRPLRRLGHVAEYVELMTNPKATQDFVKEKSRVYDTVFVDTSSEPSEYDHVNELMEASDSVILVAASFDTVDVWYDFLTRAQRANPRMTLEQFIFNDYSGTSNQKRTLMAALDVLSLDGYDATRYCSTLPHSEEMERCAEDRIPIFIVDPKMRDVYHAFTENLCNSRRSPLVKDLIDAMEEREGLEPDHRPSRDDDMMRFLAMQYNPYPLEF